MKKFKLLPFAVLLGMFSSAYSMAGTTTVSCGFDSSSLRWTNDSGFGAMFINWAAENATPRMCTEEQVDLNKVDEYIHSQQMPGTTCTPNKNCDVPSLSIECTGTNPVDGTPLRQVISISVVGELFDRVVNDGISMWNDAKRDCEKRGFEVKEHYLAPLSSYLGDYKLEAIQ